jgi:phosphate:Na+ symporter
MSVMLHDILVPLGIGLAIFLFGIKAMEIGLAEWAGAFLTKFMKRFTRTPLRGLAAGTTATVLLQSSSAVTVITIGLVNAGVLSFRQTLGIVLGANIGACLTADMLGLDMTSYAIPLLIAFGINWFIFIVPIPLLASVAAAKAKHTLLQRIALAAPSIRGASLSVCGFACILLGMEWMDSIVPALQERGLFLWFVEHANRSLIWGLAAGAVVTGIIQSATATIVITMGLASVQAIPVDLGIAIMLGANIGSCSTAFLATIGGTRAGQYVAASNILLNLVGSMLFYPFIGALQALASFGTDSAYDQIARAQTLFNVICSVVALPLCYLQPSNYRRNRNRSPNSNPKRR